MARISSLSVLLLSTCLHIHLSSSASLKLPQKDSLIPKRRLREESSSNAAASLPPDARFLFMREVPDEITEVKLQNNWLLECEAGGSPPPTIHWLKDGQPIGQGVRTETEESAIEAQLSTTFSSMSATRSRLFVDCMAPQDEGIYTCVADTPYRRVTAETHVYLSADLPPVFNPSCMSKKKQFGKKASAAKGKPARITMWTAQLLQEAGTDAVLYCRVSGEPKPTIEWLIKDDISETEIHNGNRYQILDNGDLIVRNISFDDMAGYTCVATNFYGKDSATTFLYAMAPEK